MRGGWGEPALGEWCLRDLVGHTSRALLTVETYLSGGATRVEVETPVDYFRILLSAAGDPAAVAQRGRDAGAALGSDPARAVAELAERVLTRVRAASPDALVSSPAGGMRLVDYLPTRTFELTVHTCDLAVTLGRPLEVPEAPAAATLALAGGLAARAGQAGPLLLAATGRRALPGGFTVV